MKKGIIITILIALSLILFKPPKINAETLVGWGINYDNGGSGLWHDCSGSTTCTNQKALTMLTDDYANRSYLVGDTTATIAKNGITITYRYPIVKDQLYNVQIGFCANKSISDIMYTQRNFDLYPANLGNPGQSYLKLNKYLDFYLVDTYPFSPDRSVGAQCYLVTSYIVASENTTAVTLRLRNNNTSITGFSPALIGYKITTLGLYSESLEEVIDNSGIASAESVEQVQESVTRVEQEITGEFETPTTPSEEIEGKEDLDNLKNKEEELLGNLDFSGAENIEVTINPETSKFIWEMIERIRNMNGKIILFMTSILSIGIIKLILNR